jgi:uncharacterized SAM-dependent methyltransferase
MIGGRRLVEFGSGASTKTRLLLDAAPQTGGLCADRHQPSALDEAARRHPPRLSEPRRGPLVDDFTPPVSLPPAARGRPRTGFFPGSTIGNFAPARPSKFLAGAHGLLGDGAHVPGRGRHRQGRGRAGGGL